MIAPVQQHLSEKCAVFVTGTIEPHRSSRQGLGRTLHFRQTALLEATHRGLELGIAQPPVPSGKGRVEVDRLPKELLSERVVLAGKFAQMPQPALVGGPGVEASRRLAQ